MILFAARDSGTRSCFVFGLQIFFSKAAKNIDQDDLNFCAKPFASFEQMNAPTATIDSL